MESTETGRREASTDRRIRKTRAALKKALTTLMQQKQVKDISVRELTDLADVNRGTFYLHYKDVFDLLEQSEDDILEELHETVSKYDEAALKENPILIFEGIYNLCRDNADFVNILIGENGDIKFLRKLEHLVRERCLNEWSFIMKNQDPDQFDIYYAFIAGGCISVLQYWFRSGMQETPHELAMITGKILHSGLSMSSN
ncbi:MAG: TetR/AcrR family transcriptional regulator [Oribacterium sp.]|jgi:AcrR family transcriptional regulator|nr:TetR/AcrR family transcriptional regulator [Oribacterium sp.]MDY6317470.1 TetR/AcrR family transcriptional regulator [Oribacterium sp.]